MQVARDILEPAVLVEPSLSLRALAERLLAADVEGVCVVNEAGTLVGVVTGMDLVFREKRVQTPSTLALLDLVIQLGGRKTVRELEKIGATQVDELMTREVVTVPPDAPIDRIATVMVERHVSILPVVEHGRPLGVITRRGMIALSLRHLLE